MIVIVVHCHYKKFDWWLSGLILTVGWAALVIEPSSSNLLHCLGISLFVAQSINAVEAVASQTHTTLHIHFWWVHAFESSNAMTLCLWYGEYLQKTTRLPFLEKSVLYCTWFLANINTLRDALIEFLCYGWITPRVNIGGYIHKKESSSALIK